MRALCMNQDLIRWFEWPRRQMLARQVHPNDASLLVNDLRCSIEYLFRLLFRIAAHLFAGLNEPTDWPHRLRMAKVGGYLALALQ